MLNAAAGLEQAGHANEGASPIIERLAHQLRDRGASYFDPPGQEAVADVRLIRGTRRSISQLYWYALRSGERSMVVLVKVPGAVQAPSLRPRMAPPSDAQTKYAEEHRALSLIHAHFSERDPNRFGAIRVLDLLPDHQALVMEAVDRPTLRHLAMRPGWRRVPRSPADLETAFRNAGAWLQEYHGIDAAGARHEALADREEFLDFVRQITEYLSKRLGEQAYFARVRRQVSAAAGESLPEHLPLALSHNDYCMRNILVGPSRQVTVFDTLARVRTPVYRDLSFFVTDLSFSVGPALARRAFHYPLRIEAYRTAFLDGYFAGSDHSQKAIHVFEVQALLERWCSAISSTPVSPRTRDRLRSRLSSAVFRTLVNRRL